MPSGSPGTPRVTAISPDEPRTSGSSARGTPKSSHSSSLNVRVSRSSSSVREAFDTSVACTRPPESRQTRKLSTVPNAIEPASARRRSVGDVVEQPADLGRREVRVEHQAGARAHHRLVTRALERRAGVGGAAILPDDGVGDRAAGLAVPQERGLALVGDADGAHLAGVDAARAPRRARRSPSPRSPRDRARPRRDVDRSAAARDRRATARSCARRRPAPSCRSFPDRWR